MFTVLLAATPARNLRNIRHELKGKNKNKNRKSPERQRSGGAVIVVGFLPKFFPSNLCLHFETFKEKILLEVKREQKLFKQDESRY